MRKLLVLFAVLVGVCACDRSDTSHITVCGDYEVTMEFSDDEHDTMRAVLNGDAVDLTRVVAASGAKYQGVLNDIVVVLWNKGDDWTLMLDEDTIIDCEIR